MKVSTSAQRTVREAATHQLFARFLDED
jgi:hypothetical protein